MRSPYRFALAGFAAMALPASDRLLVELAVEFIVRLKRQLGKRDVRFGRRRHERAGRGGQGRGHAQHHHRPGRAQLPPQAPVAERTRAQLLLVQRADGALIIGDTHEYAEPFAFDVDEDAYDHLRARAEALLGAPVPRVQRRWAGVYSEVDPQIAGHALYHRSEVEPGVVLVTGPGGRGMTCAPAMADETFS